MMGNIGGIEKIMVFGILVIILIILGIAFYSATKVENDLTSNKMKAAGNDEVVTVFDPPAVVEEQPAFEPAQKPIFKDVLDHSRLPERNPTALKMNSTMQEETPPEPAGDEQAVEPPPKVEEPKERIYEVKPGDSLMKIARAMYGDSGKYKILMEANPDVDPNNLQIGQKLKIPDLDAGTAKRETETEESAPEGARTYVVQSGDTLVDISIAMYGTGSNWRKIFEANQNVLESADVLRVGTKLIIP